MLLSVEWMAGFFDGEGCVLISKDSGVRHHKRPAYTLCVIIGNTDKRPLEQLVVEFGGDLRDSQRGVNQVCAYWRVSAQKAQRFLEWIQPHVFIKKEQLDLALEFQANRGLGGGRGRPLNDEAVAYREQCYRQLQQMKRPHLNYEE